MASQLGGEVVLVDTDGLGGSAVLTDCVPSKTLLAAAAAACSLKGRARASLIVLASRLLPLPWALRVAQGSIRLNEM